MSYFTNISHEFRTPLTTMLGSIRQLCAAPGQYSANRELLNVLQDGILRMLQLVNQLLDFNKLDNDNLDWRSNRPTLPPPSNESSVSSTSMPKARI